MSRATPMMQIKFCCVDSKWLCGAAPACELNHEIRVTSLDLNHAYLFYELMTFPSDKAPESDPDAQPLALAVDEAIAYVEHHRDAWMEVAAKEIRSLEDKGFCYVLDSIDRLVIHVRRESFIIVRFLLVEIVCCS